jgi:hypothetical protein
MSNPSCCSSIMSATPALSNSNSKGLLATATYDSPDTIIRDGLTYHKVELPFSTYLMPDDSRCHRLNCTVDKYGNCRGRIYGYIQS